MAKDDPLADEPFSYRLLKDERVRIFHRSQLAMTLKGAAASRFMARMASADPAEAQLLMARVTGQFKFGNEKQIKRDRP